MYIYMHNVYIYIHVYCAFNVYTALGQTACEVMIVLTREACLPNFPYACLRWYADCFDCLCANHVGTRELMVLADYILGTYVMGEWLRSKSEQIMAGIA